MVEFACFFFCSFTYSGREYFFFSNLSMRQGYNVLPLYVVPSALFEWGISFQI